jgi:hypothetical protein
MVSKKLLRKSELRVCEKPGVLVRIGQLDVAV